MVLRLCHATRHRSMADRSSTENMSHMPTFSYLETFLFSPSQAAMASCFVAVCAASTLTMESWTWRQDTMSDTPLGMGKHSLLKYNLLGLMGLLPE